MDEPSHRSEKIWARWADESLFMAMNVPRHAYTVKLKNQFELDDIAAQSGRNLKLPKSFA
jgi:hypothetical protein